MKKFLKDFCFCWFGQPVGSENVQNLINNDDKDTEQIESYDKDNEMAEGMIDTSDWQTKDIKNLTPYQIKDSDLTKEYNIPEMEIDQKIKELGYVLGDELGKGAFGRVRVAFKFDKNGEIDKTEGSKMACKEMNLIRLRYGPKDSYRMACFKNELFTLVKSKHKNIIGIKDHFIINKNCYLIMEHANKGNLSKNLKKRGPYSEEESMYYFAQISSGIYYLHCKLGIAHLDIKLENLLIVGGNDYKNRTIKVTDFGLSRLRIDEKKGVIKEKNPRGTVAYMSPQVLRLYILDRLNEESIFGKVKPFNPFIADVWSLGVCLFLMLFHDLPFEDQEDDPRLLRHQLDAQKHKNIRYNEKYYKKFEKDISIGCKDMIEDCLEPNPHKRLTIQNVVSHYWFEGYFTIEELSGSKP